MSIEKKPRMSVAARAVTVVLVAVFCFQLSRFYVSVDACQHHQDDGNVLQHCKDLPSWLTGYRIPLGTLTAPLPEPALVPIRVTAFTAADTTHDIPLPPPFHPPRFLS
ncbi:MAG: hypothetical protein ACRD88_03125 [Terriglobia bacterium]